MSEATIHNFDCITGMGQEVAAESVDLTVTSIPFGQLFSYSGKNEDLGNNGDFGESELQNPFGPQMDQIWRYSQDLIPNLTRFNSSPIIDMVNCSFALHMRFFVHQLLRVMKPGSNVCIHVQQLLRYKNAHGYIGRRDFRGAVVDIFEAGGFEWKGEFGIPKNPQIIAKRNSLHSLMFVTGKRNAADLAPAPNDFVLIFQKPGERIQPVPALLDRDNPNGWVTTEEWIKWAYGCWTDIRETDVLDDWQAGRDTDDEKHVCPLQLEVIRRLIRLYTNPGELVLDPFMGIGSTAVIAIELGREAVGFELKGTYHAQAVRNAADAVRRRDQDAGSLLVELQH